MPEEPIYQWDAWRYDQSSQQLTRQDPSGQEFSTTIDILTNNRYTIIGSQVRERATGRIVWNIPQTRDFSVVTTAGGRVLLSNDTPESGINASRLERGGYAVGFAGELALPDGTTRQFSADYTAVTTLGQRLAIDESKIGRNRFVYVDNTADPRTGQLPQLPTGLRWATAREAIERAIVGELFDKQRNLLDDLTKLDLMDEYGNPLDNQSDVAAYLARIAAGSINYRTIGFA